MPDPNSPDGPNGIYILPEADFSGIQKQYLNIAYANNSSFNTLDIYLPGDTPPKSGYPLLMFIHGGAWMMCDKRDVQVQPALELLKRGVAVASINYRLSSEALFPAQIQDAKAAVRWLRSKGSEYQLNTERIAAWGDSSGAHLAMLLGMSAGIEKLEDLTMGNAEYSSEVQAVVSWFGPSDFLSMDAYLTESGNGDADHWRPESPESLLLGAPIADVPEAVAEANPETYLTRDCPPVLFQHGTADPLVPHQLSMRFHRRIVECCGENRARLDLLEGEGHGGPQFETAENIRRVGDFILHFVST